MSDLCVTCGAALAGRYCHACGERVLDASDLRLGTFARRVAGGVFDLDSRLWRTFRDLVTKPGRLTAEFAQGRRKPYLHPLQVFLLANLLFFGVLSTIGGVNTFTTQLRYHLTQTTYGGLAERMVSEHGAPGSDEAAAYAARFDEAIPRYANSMIILMVPLFALALALLFVRRGEPLVKHLVFALHFMAFLLLVMTVLPFFIVLIALLGPTGRLMAGSDLPISILLLSGLVLYLAPAMRRAYGDGRGVAIARGIGAAVLLVPTLIVYRMLLFFTVYFMID